MSGTYTTDEKVEYALKTALFRTMQSKDQPSSLEKSAPPRIFPKNIMKKNLIEKGEGDIDEDGYYVGRSNSNSAYYQNNDLVNLEEAELTISNYRIIDPASNKITDKRVSDMTTVNISQTSHSAINALDTNTTNYPLKNWFFRGHYGSHSGTAAFEAASLSYDGLQLAWDKSTVGATAGESDIVPHLKFYLQVQTNFTNVAHGDNITYGHDLMKGLIGLDQNFSTTIQVVQGQGGNCVTLGTTGASTGDFWFTQATSGTLSFYGVTNKVNASASLSNLATTKFPMISYIRYTGETGFGAGSGGGGGAAADPQQAVTEEPSWSSDSMTTRFIDGVIIASTEMNSNSDSRPAIATRNSSTSIKDYEISAIPYNYTNFTSNYAWDHGFLRIRAGGGTNVNQTSYIDLTGYSQNADMTRNIVFGTAGTERMRINSSGNVGIGISNPGQKLEVNGNINIEGSQISINPSTEVNYTYFSGVNSVYTTFQGNKNLQLRASNGKIFFTAGTSGSSSDRMVIDTAGNVGIGTASPSEKLQVNGRLRIEAADHSAGVWFVGNGVANDNGSMFFGRAGAAFSGIGFWVDDWMHAFLDNGNVGIGTTSPDAPLQISGQDMKEGLRITRTNTTSSGSYGPYILLHNEIWGGRSVWGNYDSNNTKFGPLSNNSLEIITNATTRMTIRHAGNVGIGTTSPDHKLEIYESTGFVRLCMESSSTGKLLLGTHNDGRVFLYNEKNSYIHFGTNNSERMRIDNVGNVGIGETNPGAPLHIKFTQSGDPTNNIKDMIKLETQYSTDFNGSYREGGSSILFYVENTTDQGLPGEAARIVAGCYESSSTTEYHSYLAFHTSNNSGSTGTNERMIIDDNGYVGIGTMSPQTMLDVRGEGGGSSGGNCLALRNGNSQNEYSGSQILFSWNGYPYNSQGYSHKIQSRHQSGTTHTDNAIDFYLWKNGQSHSEIGNTHGMSITAEGVGIGTTSPQTKLDVAGDYSRDGEIISMTCQYGLNAKASIFNDWFREEHTNWGLYWINNVTYDSLDYSTLVPYARTTNDGTTGYTSTGVTGKSISSLMTAYSPGDRGERIGSTNYDLGTYAHHTFTINFGYWANGYASTYIRTNDDPWKELPKTSGGSGSTVDIMFTGYIKCNETNTYYFAIKSIHYYTALLFIQAPNEGTGTMWGFGGGGWQYKHRIRTDGISMTAGKYYKIAFCTHGSGYYYYNGAGIQLGWTKDGTFSTSNYYAGTAQGDTRLYHNTDIDGKTNWNTRLGWISADSPLQFVKRIPN